MSGAVHPDRIHDVVIVGAGAAGLMAGIHAARAAPKKDIVVVDGSPRVGAKILVAGGGRCNVTHHEVTERAFAGSTPGAIRKVLRRFDVPATIAFFRELGVTLKREETGKLFPTTDRAQTVLDALLTALTDAGASLRDGCRVSAIDRDEGVFNCRGDFGVIAGRRLILATGGRALPKTGSDGGGYLLASVLGHTITERVFPALVPLCTDEEAFVRTLSGIACPAEVQVRSGSGAKLAAFEGDVLCTHFGLSGPAILDVSRYFLDAREDDAAARLVISWLPGEDFASLDRELTNAPACGRLLIDRGLPRRLVETLCAEADIDPATPGRQVPREARRSLVRGLIECDVEITTSRGYKFAEVTAGGIPLTEVNLKTMASKACPGLFLAGEICDVDGRIGGFNFQWAWASGFVAGRGSVG